MQKPTIITESEEYDFTTMQRDLDKAKSALFMDDDAAFYGPLMCSLEFVWAKGLNTAATDGTYLWWDPEDFLRCDLEERKATIKHELKHVANLHALRQGTRCNDTWNKACDYKINRELVSEGYTFISDSPYWIIGPQYDHLELEEQIYDELMKQQQKGGGGAKKPKAGSGQPGSSHACQHGQFQLTQVDKQNMINATVKAIQSAKFANGAGSIPGDLESTIEKFLKPIIPWETVLYNFFNDLGDDDYSWTVRDRRFENIYLPDIESSDRLEHLAYYLDVSGSVSDADVLRFNSEVKFIKDTFNPVKLSLILFDTKIQKVYEFTEDDPFEKIIVIGRGGTSLVPVRDHILKTRPTAAIIFSDLDCAPMAPGVQCPVIWVAVANRDAKVNFGKIIHIRSET